jgi:hypothetical protein
VIDSYSGSIPCQGKRNGGTDSVFAARAGDNGYFAFKGEIIDGHGCSFVFCAWLRDYDMVTGIVVIAWRLLSCLIMEVLDADEKWKR